MGCVFVEQDRLTENLLGIPDRSQCPTHNMV